MFIGCLRNVSVQNRCVSCSAIRTYIAYMDICWDAPQIRSTKPAHWQSASWERGLVSQCVLSNSIEAIYSDCQTSPQVNHSSQRKKKTKTPSVRRFLGPVKPCPSLILHWCGIISLITSRHFIRKSLREGPRVCFLELSFRKRWAKVEDPPPESIEVCMY